MIVNTPHKVAVVLGTYNRGELLRRSLLMYEQFQDVELVVFDDGSTDDTKLWCQLAECRVHYFYLGDKTGYRDSASYLNRGIKYALNELQASHVFITHPEIIPGPTTIGDAIDVATDDNTWVSCKGYYLTPEQQYLVSLVNDIHNCDTVRFLPNFYGSAQSAEFTGNPDYTPEAIEAAPVWHSWIFAGGSAAMWRRFGGLTPFETWGSVDVDLLNRRNIGGIRTVTPQALSSYVVHQNHDDNAQRDMAKCMAALPVYTSPEQAFKPELLQ